MYEQKMAERNMILKFRVGSYLYGTATPESDQDFVAVFIPEKDYVLGLKHCDEVDAGTKPSDATRRNTSADVDFKYYSLAKFIKLVMECNPNMVELLFVPEQHIMFSNQYGRRLLEAAPLFVNKQVYDRFFGYAKSQKMKLIYRQYEGNRLEIVKKYGYDTKFAYHLVRLLVEGHELLTTGKVVFPLANSPYLTEVKTGQHALEDVMNHVYELEKTFTDAQANSVLPDTADREALNKLQMELYEDFWKYAR